MNKNMFKFSFLIQLMLFLTLVSCAEMKSPASTGILGLYQVVERTCDVSKRFKENCEKTRFIELVKGQFYGVKNDEVALVIWRGDVGEELSYQATKLNHGVDVAENKTSIIVASTASYDERLLIHDGKVVEYKSTFKKSEKENHKMRRMYRYTLKPVIRSELPEFRMNYPGNS